MKKLWVGLIAGFLATASPAAAQVPGSQDPLSLITNGMILPYFGGAAGASFLEVYAPVSGGTVHMFFFNETCTRVGDSAQLDLTTNDIELLQVDNLTTSPSGLITASGVDATGFTLQPDNFPPGVHARVLWVTPQGTVRLLEPIALSTFDNDSGLGPLGGGTWNPLRTAATFFAPPQGGGAATTLYLVCPNTNIQGLPPSVTSPSGAFDPDEGFPIILPEFRIAGQTTPLRVRIYDDEEVFLRDVVTNCNCLTTRPVTEISPVYADTAAAPLGTYSEVFGFGRVVVDPAVCDTSQVEPLVSPPNPNPGNDCPLITIPPATTPTFQNVQITPAVRENRDFSFTGYRAVTVGSVDIFGRLHNGCADAIAGDPVCEKWGGR